ncbi:two-component regulator propeller domain-containing protein [Mucilaginibacter sp. PAMB04274]|uniref:hybrid sensor histidine kinase/response regulator transcription factor n=1 Tax=Mucilaginibacter sp. PAMB04274 TaxID=3138568 RepID=UPI0031F71362
MNNILYKKYSFCILMLLFTSYFTFGSEQVRCLGIEKGLSNNSVTAIFKDYYGYMWFGTYDGLNRYDGQKFKIFRNSWGDVSSLGNNHITTLTGNTRELVVGTQKGLFRYDYRSAKFAPLQYYFTQAIGQRPVTASINSLVSGKDGTVYAGAEKLGLLLYRGKNAVCQKVVGANGSTYTVQALALDTDDQLFVFVANEGLFRLNKKNNVLQPVNRDLGSATCMLFDRFNNQVWIGTENGLYYYDQKDGILHRYQSSLGKLSSYNITDLNYDSQGNLWVSTNGGGINILNIKQEKLTYLTPGREQGRLRSGAISAVYMDNESRKWIATLRGGVNIVEPDNGNFKQYRHDPFNKNSVVNDFILSFCEDERRNIWIGTDGGGLSYWNRKTNAYQNFVHSTDPKSLQSNFVVSVVKDYTNRIWVASFSGGIDAFNPNTNSFIHYTCYNPVRKAAEKNMWKLFEDSKHNLWAGATRGGALYKYNRVKDCFEIYDNTLTDIHVIFEDAAGTLWAGDYADLISISPNTRTTTRYNVGYALRAISQSDRSSLWIGTEGGGLLRFNLSSHRFERYTQKDGLAGNSVLNTLVANNGDLWCSTYNGLSRLDVKRRVFTNYNGSDGLQSNQFNYNAALKLRSGELLFGGISGFNLFDPDSIRSVARSPKLRINDVRIGNATVNGSSEFTDGKPIAQLREITVPYNEATIAIEYTALEYSLPDKINYAYYLEGWDHGWNSVGKLQTAYYTRLNEGSYRLHIKASDTQGKWSAGQLTIEITILPPWYRTWWAYLLYIGVGGATLYWFWLYRSRQQQLRYEVQIANLNMEREKELNEKKLSFFTNVSHEFRTPLTLIINPIKDLLSQNKGQNDELNVIYRNARRLLGLVDHLLLFRKTETENASLRVSRMNFVTICNEVFMCFTHQVKIKHLKYTLVVSNEQMEVYADREKIEIALFNLISNAIKFTPDGGEIQVMVHDDGTQVFFEIADSGIGISADVGEMLFDKFFRIKDKQYSKTGFGIGLYLVKNFIDSHFGKIYYHASKLGGTTFIMSLPKGNAHFSEEQIDETIISPTHINELIDHDNKDILPEEESNNLELLISDKQTILVIDDNDQIRNYIKKLLTPEYRVIESEDGQAGLKLIKVNLPDLVLSDIVMGELNGIELCKILKDDNATNHIPIILLTGNATPELMLKSINEGAADFISKPFEKDVLLAKVKSVLRSKKELQNYFYQEITSKNTIKNVSEEHKDFLYKCISIIEAHLTDPAFDVESLARMMKMSYPTLFKRIKSTTGKSINNFIRFVRLRKAAELLIRTNCNVNEAAFQVGINDLKYFREQFHKQFDLNPSEFLKKHRANFQTTYRVE